MTPKEARDSMEYGVMDDGERARNAEREAILTGTPEWQAVATSSEWAAFEAAQKALDHAREALFTSPQYRAHLAIIGCAL